MPAPQRKAGATPVTRDDLEAAIWAAMDTHRMQGPRRDRFVAEVMHAASQYAAFRNNGRRERAPRAAWALTGKAEGVLAMWDAWEAQMAAVPPRSRFTMRDDTLPHQIRVGFAPDGNHLLAVTCTCRDYRDPLEVRASFEPDEPMTIWRAHMAALEEAASRG